MRNTVRAALASVAFLVIFAWARPAAADTTIMGTVGELSVSSSSQAVRFKLTDVNQTAACIDQVGNGFALKYAYIRVGDPVFREIYAMLLVSKKGSPIVCAITNNSVCSVTSCTLP